MRYRININQRSALPSIGRPEKVWNSVPNWRFGEQSKNSTSVIRNAGAGRQRSSKLCRDHDPRNWYVIQSAAVPKYNCVYMSILHLSLLKNGSPNYPPPLCCAAPYGGRRSLRVRATFTVSCFWRGEAQCFVSSVMNQGKSAAIRLAHFQVSVALGRMEANLAVTQNLV